MKTLMDFADLIVEEIGSAWALTILYLVIGLLILLFILAVKFFNWQRERKAKNHFHKP